MIKNPIAVFVATLVMASSCASAGEGAYNGAAFGSILGSAIGGISDGPRGHDLGTIVGIRMRLQKRNWEHGNMIL